MRCFKRFRKKRKRKREKKRNMGTSTENASPDLVVNPLTGEARSLAARHFLKMIAENAGYTESLKCFYKFATK